MVAQIGESTKPEELEKWFAALTRHVALVKPSLQALVHQLFTFRWRRGSVAALRAYCALVAKLAVARGFFLLPALRMLVGGA
jgi:hypothetical protein